MGCVLSLVENTARRPGLIDEHGLAMWIEFGGRRVLFDTGQGDALLPNARVLGVPLQRTEAVILSHGHYDHTGGLGALLRIAPRATVFAHPDAFAPRFAEGGREIGMPTPARKALCDEKTAVGHTTEPTEVVPGLFATGPVPRRTQGEETSGPFYRDRTCREPDRFTDDQAVFFDSDDGVVVLLGCAHAGVINTLRFVRSLTGDRPLYAVVGGMHLRAADDKRIERTVREMEEMGVDAVHPAHCTGEQATVAMRRGFGGRCRPWSVGTQLNVNEQAIHQQER